MAFAARDFSPRRGASDEHIPQWICEERATKSGRKRTAARRVAPNLACGFVARRSQPHWRGMLPPRASPQAKLGATNVTIFTLVTTKPAARAVSRQTKPAMFIVPKLAAKSDSFAALGCALLARTSAPNRSRRHFPTGGFVQWRELRLHAQCSLRLRPDRSYSQCPATGDASAGDWRSVRPNSVARCFDFQMVVHSS